MLQLNDKVPDFKLNGIDETGTEKNFTLKELLAESKNLVLYFYPRDNTPGCTQEACDFRDNFNRITSKAIVVGVSPDSIESHRNFREKQDINFILLSDPEHTLMEKFGAWGEKTSYGKKTIGVLRSTFIIGNDGLIKKEWRNVNVKGHVDEVLKELSILD